MMKKFPPTFLCVLCALSIRFMLGHMQQQEVNVHIFIHGTRCSGLAAVSAISVIRNKVKNYHLYAKAIQKARTDTRFYDSQIMLKKGLVEVSHETIMQCHKNNLPIEKARQTAIQAIKGYDELTNNKAINRYYTYGWDGMLSDEDRKNDSRALYLALVSLSEELRKRYPTDNIKFILHGHSHGGNLILYMSVHEKELKQNLIIDKTILYGTPIQTETAYFCIDPMFTTIINIHSEGDSIQVSDKISTPSKTSKRRLSDFVDCAQFNNGKKHLIDVRISANGNSKAFSHASYFLMNMYNNIGSSIKNPALRELSPLPLATYSPLFMNLIDKISEKNARCSFIDLNFESHAPNQCTIRAQVPDLYICIRSENIAPQIKSMRERVEKTWRPHARYGHAKIALLAAEDLIKAIPEYFKRS